jgi:hypothetical protein
VTGPAAQTLRLASDADVADLTSYVDRLARYEPLGVVRLQARGSALGVFAQPPFGVLVLRAVRLRGASDGLDVTVPHGSLARAVREGGVDVVLPESVPGPPWAGMLPPVTGWLPVAQVPVGAVRAAVAAGVRDFKAAVADLPEQLRSHRETLDRIAAATWDRPVVAGMPLRAGHAASSLGFLASDPADRVTVLSAGSWLRLDAGFGSAFTRSGAVPTLRLA